MEKKKFKSWLGKDISKNKEKNICMFCGRQSKNRFTFRILNKQDDYRDFCSLQCVMNYYNGIRLKRKSKVQQR